MSHRNLWIPLQRSAERITASRLAFLKLGDPGKAGDSDDGEVPKKVTVRGGKSTSRNRSIKYVCPVCGTIIRATRQVNVKCGDCDVAFEAQ